MTMAYPDKIGPTHPVVPAHPAEPASSRTRVIKPKKDDEHKRERPKEEKKQEDHQIDEYV